MECPTIGISMGGVKLKALLDTGLQVTLIQEVMDSYFSQIERGDAPLVFALKAAKGLSIPYSAYRIQVTPSWILKWKE